MKVAIAVKGRFHAFDLARQLQERGLLGRLITSYPRWLARRFGVAVSRVSSVFSNEVMDRAARRVPAGAFQRLGLQPRLHQHFARRAAARLQAGNDVLVAWSGVALPSIGRARELGMKVVVERGSSHIAHQRDVLQREYQELGLVPRLPHPAVIETEQAEYAAADAVSVPSSFARDTFLARGFPASKLLRAPYGVALDAFSPAPQRDGVFRVLHCGSVSVRKGCHALLEAFQALRLPRSELVFVGPVERELWPYLRRRAGSGVVFRGALPQARLAAEYARASVFCLASVEEGLAMVLPQAMACGLPVVATRSTGAGDLIASGTEGLILAPRDSAALQAALEWLYRHPGEREEMGRSARQRVLQGLTWSDYGDRVARNLARVVRGEC